MTRQARAEPNRDRSNNGLRRVTAFTAACVIVSNMIGTGIFGTTGFMARDLGHSVVIMALWAAGGLFALLGAFCYCELGAAMPRAGGEYVYIREAYGPLWGFLSGWMSLTIGFSAAIASNAHLFTTHLCALFPSIATWQESGGAWRYLLHDNTIALATVWVLTLIHARGVGAGGFVQRLLTLLKVGAIVVLVAAGVAYGEGSIPPMTSRAGTASPGLTTMLVAFLFVTFSYTGWNAAGYIAGEMIQPQRSLPRATIVATVCVTVLYLALNAIYLYALPIADLAADPIEPVAHKAAQAMFGGHAARWITLMLCVSIFGAISAMVWAGPRVYYAMAEDGAFPSLFARTAASAAPVRSILLQSVWVSVLIVAGGFEALVRYAGFVLIIFTALAVGAVMVLRIRRPDRKLDYRLPGYPFVPVAYLVISLAVMWAAVFVRPTESLLGLVTVAAGIPFYFAWTRTRKTTTVSDR